MRVQEARLFKAPNESFIFYHEKNEFSHWHHHPEYELVFIVKGNGIRMIGDHIDRFKANDLVLLGPYLPHEWRCDDHFTLPSGEFIGEAIVIQFLNDSFGKSFFELPENNDLKKIFHKSLQGCQFIGNIKDKIISIMKKMLTMNETERLYALFSIFECLSFTNKYNLLSSPAFLEPFRASENEPIQKAVQYILQNFQKNIKISDLLNISNMSSTTFFMSFKKMHRMTFKEYLLSIRIGYACRLLGEDNMNISQIAYECGFENLSNFNRHFKKIKGYTPKQYKKHLQRESNAELNAAIEV